MRRWVERAVIWGGAVVVVVVVCQAGLHPVGAVVVGVAAALVIAGVLSAGARPR